MSVADPAITAAPGGGAPSGDADVADLGAARPLRKDVWKRFKRNKLAVVGLVFIVLLVLVAIFAPWIAPYDFDQRNTGGYGASPSLDNLFGTDQLGQDVFSRVVYGARISLADRDHRHRHGACDRSGVRCGGRVLRRNHRDADHAPHRHLPRHPLHRAGHRHRYRTRQEGRQHRDPGAGPHGLAGDLPDRAGQLPVAEAAGVRRGRPRARLLAQSHHVPAHPAERPAADHCLRHHHGRLGDPVGGGVVVPRRRTAAIRRRRGA